MVGVILAGGESRRFGSNKAFARWRGRTMIESVIRSSRSVCDDVFLSVRDEDEFHSLGLPMLADRPGSPRSPLSGLITATAVLPGHFLVLSADAPAVQPGVLELLVTRAEEQCGNLVEDEAPRPVVFRDSVGLLPFPGVYHASHRRVFEQAVWQRRFRLTEALEHLNPLVIAEESAREIDPDLLSFRNVNTPADLDELGCCREVTV